MEREGGRERERERKKDREINSAGRTTGKSLLMDMFFDEAKSRIPHLPARRVHFHDFMASVHQAIHDRKHTRKGSLGAVRDVGMEMAAKSRLLCFDEMQVQP
jgi:cell division protein ZapE